MADKDHVRVYIELLAGQDDDLIKVVERLKRDHYGAISQYIRTAMRAYGGQVPAGGQPRSVEAEIDYDLIRLIVDASLEEKLAGWSGGEAPLQPTQPGAALRADEDTDRLLDEIGAGFTLEEPDHEA